MHIEKSDLLYVTSNSTANPYPLAPTLFNPNLQSNESQQNLALYAREQLGRSEIHQDGEWRLDEDGGLAPILALIQGAPEWGYLIGEVEVSPEAYEVGKQAIRMAVDASEVNNQNSIAERAALSEQGIEVWRTTNAVDCTLVLGRGDPEGADWFRGRPDANGTLPPHALTDQQYTEFSHDFRKLAGDNEGFLAFIIAEFVHDLAKSAALIEESGKLGTTTTGRSHDDIIHDVIASEAKRDRLLPTLAKVKEFSPDAYELAIKVLSIETNYAQLLTGEAPARVMEEVLGIDSQVRGLFFFKHRLDIAGALGHRQHAGSLTMDSETYQDMVDLEWAITTPELEDDAVVRNNAYIQRRGLRLGVDIAACPNEERDEMYACVRLAMRRRVHEPEVFEKILYDFNNAPLVVKSILTILLNRNGTNDKAVLPGYSQAVLMGMAKDPQFAENYLDIYAMLLHEASLYAPAKGPDDTGITIADLKDIATAINKKNINFGSAIRFSVKERSGNKRDDDEAMIYPEIHKPALSTLDSLEDFDGHFLRGKRLGLVGMAGAKDNLHAAALGSLLSQKYDATLAGIMTFRKPEQTMRGGQAFGASAILIQEDSVPEEIWTRGHVEKTLLEVLQSDGGPTIAISNANNHTDRLADLEAFSVMNDVDLIIGVDPGGDSFSYREANPKDLAHLGTERDHQAISALNKLAYKRNLPVYSGVIAPDIYARYYSLTLMRRAGTQRLPLTPHDRAVMLEIYDHTGTLHAQDANYSTTAMLFHRAALGQLGLQSIDLPAAIATSPQDPWRVFFEVTQASGGIALTEISHHYGVTLRPTLHMP